MERVCLLPVTFSLVWKKLHTQNSTIGIVGVSRYVLATDDCADCCMSLPIDDRVTPDDQVQPAPWHAVMRDSAPTTTPGGGGNKESRANHNISNPEITYVRLKSKRHPDTRIGIDEIVHIHHHTPTKLCCPMRLQ